MATEPTIAILRSAPIVVRTRMAGVYAAAVDYWALTKPEVNFLVLVATFVGFRLGSNSAPAPVLVHTLVGTLLVASGAAVLNQFTERSFDAQMRRTSRRPLAAGKLRPSNALWFGISLSVLGGLYLAVINILTAVLALAALLSYLLLYTPLKRKTPLCTLVGAFPGAVPPLIGWAAARGRLDSEAWVLYFILFLWQFPHFMSIAWMYREDYSRAGYQVLPARRIARSFCHLAKLRVCNGPRPSCASPGCDGRSGHRLRLRCGPAELGLPLFKRALCFSSVQRQGETASDRFDLLPPSTVYPLAPR